MFLLLVGVSDKEDFSKNLLSRKVIIAVEWAFVFIYLSYGLSNERSVEHAIDDRWNSTLCSLFNPFYWPLMSRLANAFSAETESFRLQMDQPLKKHRNNNNNNLTNTTTKTRIKQIINLFRLSLSIWMSCVLSFSLTVSPLVYVQWIYDNCCSESVKWTE